MKIATLAKNHVKTPANQDHSIKALSAQFQALSIPWLEGQLDFHLMAHNKINHLVFEFPSHDSPQTTVIVVSQYKAQVEFVQIVYFKEQLLI